MKAFFSVLLVSFLSIISIKQLFKNFDYFFCKVLRIFRRRYITRPSSCLVPKSTNPTLHIYIEYIQITEIQSFYIFSRNPTLHILIRLNYFVSKSSSFHVLKWMKNSCSFNWVNYPINKVWMQTLNFMLLLSSVYKTICSTPKYFIIMHFVSQYLPLRKKKKKMESFYIF